MLPFEEVTLASPNPIQRFFGQQSKGNASKEISNSLARARDVRQVLEDEVQAVADKYRAANKAWFRKELAEIYRLLLQHCLTDRHLSDDETAQLLHLKSILGLSDSDVGGIHDDVAQTVYEESVDEAISDGRLDTDERSFLDRLQTTLKLPKETADRIYGARATDYMSRYLASALEDERLSPDEEKELTAIAGSLGVNVEYEEKTKAMLDRSRLFWLIENGEVPTLGVDINLQKNESCYFQCDVNWHEHRRVTKRIRYSGPTARIKIVKGLYWRAGDLAVQSVSEDVLQHIDSGRLFVTNKRLIFMGGRKNTNIRLSKILDFTPYKNGVDIQKDTGKSPFLEFEKGVDVFCVILDRAIRDS